MTVANNTTLTASIVAKAAVGILENELTMAGLVYRGYEDEFDKKVNGYNIGDTVTISRPTDFTVRNTITAGNPAQGVQEPKLTLKINQVAGVDFSFTSQQLTLNIDELSKRVIRPAMVQVANQIDIQVMALFRDIPQWVSGVTPVANGQGLLGGTPTINSVFNSFNSFASGPKNMDIRSIPGGDRYGILTPNDYWGMAGAQTALFNQTLNGKAFSQGRIGDVGGVDTYLSQNAPTFLTGPGGGAPVVNGAGQATAIDLTGANTQTLITNGWTAAAAPRVVVGDTFTIAGVFDVNPVTKVPLPILKQFVVAPGSQLNSDGAGNLTLTIAPQIIVGGAFATVSAAPAAGAALTFNLGAAANTLFGQNLFFDKNAFALAVVPMVKPPGAVDVSRVSRNGISVRVIPFYDGISDVSQWRLDVIFGTQTVDRRLAARVTGS